MVEFLDKTSISINVGNPILHFYQDYGEVDANENFNLVENWIKNKTYSGAVSLENLVKIMKDSVSRFMGGEGYRLDECEIRANVEDSYLSFYTTSKETQDAFNGANYIFIEFNRLYINIGR